MFMISFSKRALDWGCAALKYCGTQLIKIFTLVIFACLSNAAELGELRVYSTLGEPLKAEIDLANMEGISAQELEVRLLLEEAAEQSGVPERVSSLIFGFPSYLLAMVQI